MHSCPHSLTLILLLRLSLADALRIDDRDPAIQYNGPWSYGTEIHDNASLNWDGTLRYSNISGATATLRFTGTSISVFGSFHPPGRYSMQSQYSVDGQQPFTFIPLQEVPASIHQTLFYSSPRFPHGEHTLVVTNLGEQLFLDFFDVQDETVPPSISTTPATSITSPTVPSQTSTSSAEGNRTTTVPSNAPTQPLASDPSATSDSQKPNVASEFTFVTETSLAAATTAPPSESLPLTAGTTRASASTPAGNSTIAPVGAAQSPTQRSPRGISKGAIAGIAVGSLIIIAVLGAGLWWYWRSRERTWLVTDDENSNADPLRGCRAREDVRARPQLPRAPPDAARTDLKHERRLRRPPCFRASAERWYAVVVRASHRIRFDHTVDVLWMMKTTDGQRAWRTLRRA